MSQSALLADCLPRELSFKHSLQLWLALRQRGADAKEDQVVDLLVLIAQRRVGKRLGRIEDSGHKTKTSSIPLADQTTSISKGGDQKIWASETC